MNTPIAKYSLENTGVPLEDFQAKLDAISLPANEVDEEVQKSFFSNFAIPLVSESPRSYCTGVVPATQSSLCQLEKPGGFRRRVHFEIDSDL